MSEEALSYQQIRYNEYSKQRSELAKTNVELGGRYDQWILTLSAGAIALSVAFLEKISPHPEPNTVFLIGLAWAALVVSLLGGFISLLTAQYSALRQIQILDEDYLEFRESAKQNIEGAAATKEPPKRNNYAEVTNVLNWVSAPAFVLGVIFFCLFAYANIPAGVGMSVLPTKVDVNVRLQNVPQSEPGRGRTNTP